MPDRTAVYAGSFDPITLGHVDIIERSLAVFERVQIAVAKNSSKSPLFSLDERIFLVREASSSFGKRVSVATFEGLLVDYVRSIGARVIVRGLRAVSDYEYEAQMATINGQLASDVETVFFMAGAHVSFVSSSVVKEIAINGGDISSLVPAGVVAAMNQRLKTSA